MNHRLLLAALPIGSLSFAIDPLAAQLRPLVEAPASLAAARAGVDVYLLNDGPVAERGVGPAEIDTTAADGARLRLVAGDAAAQSIAPGGFARLRYRLADAATTPLRDAPAPPDRGETIVADSSGASSGVLGRFRPHEPVYGVAGTGSAGAKLQLSFAFRALGHDDGPRLSFAYTQTIFWAIDRPSIPIRANTYSPEVFVDMPVGEGLTAGFGYRHDSNGGGIGASVDSNRLFARVSKSFTLGSGWRAEITPQGWFYVATHGDAGPVNRYLGYGSLSASVEQRDGLKIAGMARGNPATGKGAGEMFVSMPLARLGIDQLGLYLIAEAFSGYGEALADYDRRSSHARIGIAFTR